MKIFVVLLASTLAIISANAGASMDNPFYCYSTDNIRSMTNMFSHITSYEAVRRFNFTTVNSYMSTGTPSRFWYFGRDAARLPTGSLVESIINFAESSFQEDIVRNYEAGRTTLCREDYEHLRNLTLASDLGEDFTVENAATVSRSGVLAMRNIARRFQRNFPNILPTTYTPSRFHFRHDATAYTNTTIRAFASGLFGDTEADKVMYEPVPEVDWFLRPFLHCPAFDEVSSDWERQQIAFRHGPEIQEMIQQVNWKLGFRGSNKMEFDDIYIMWTWCRLKIALTFEESNSETGVHSPWCAAFSINHHLLLEYHADVGFYYRSGYGMPNQRMLENLNCGVLQDMVRHIQSENDTDTMARVFITYPETQPILMALGTFRDVWPLHQHNFAQQIDRQYLSSLISTFSANVAVIRFDHDDGDHDLIFALNERPILVPGCDQQTAVCKLSFIVNRFQRFVDANCATLFCSSD